METIMGVTVARSGRFTRAGRPLLAVAGAAILAAGCGSQVEATSSAAQPARPATASPSPARSAGIIPGGPAARGGGALCSAQASVTRLVVSRISALPQNHLHFVFPAGITVSGPARARAVAGAVCGLPAMPHGAMSCPADLGVSYRLSFAAGRTSLPVVTAGAGGCGVVTGAGPARWTARTPRFWTVLAHAMGVSQAAALRGTAPAGHGGGPAS
jgi:hypothetical protein